MERDDDESLDARSRSYMEAVHGSRRRGRSPVGAPAATSRVQPTPSAAAAQNAPEAKEAQRAEGARQTAMSPHERNEADKAALALAATVPSSLSPNVLSNKRVDAQPAGAPSPVDTAS